MLLQYYRNAIVIGAVRSNNYLTSNILTALGRWLRVFPTRSERSSSWWISRRWVLLRHGHIQEVARQDAKC
jgi:hypothetical protein